jgi:hypothetical protein
MYEEGNESVMDVNVIGVEDDAMHSPRTLVRLEPLNDLTISHASQLCRHLGFNAVKNVKHLCVATYL